MKSKVFLFFIAVCLVVLPASSCKNAEQSFWVDYIEACNPAAQLNGNAFFLGSTNTIGPGSVWGTAGGTANYVASAQTYLGQPDAKGNIPGVNYAANTSTCNAAGSRTWDLSLGLPVTISSSDAADLSLALKNAKTIIVQIGGVQIDSVPIAMWQDVANKTVDHTSAAYTDAVDGKHYLMSAGIAIDNMSVKYTLDSSLSAGLKANIQAGKSVNVGTAQNPVQAQVDVDTTGEVVTLQVNSRAYVIGQFVKIGKVPQKYQGVQVVQEDGKTILRPKSPTIPVSSTPP